ncbi:hypothetical protein HZS_7741 [Henneguya salminicola]|nr:hypothetical protein HZS_7741 [Henneguya salminicola]
MINQLTCANCQTQKAINESYQYLLNNSIGYDLSQCFGNSQIHARTCFRHVLTICWKERYDKNFPFIKDLVDLYRSELLQSFSTECKICLGKRSKKIYQMVLLNHKISSFARSCFEATMGLNTNL